ncbi:MAG: phosphomannomutase [Thiohalobacteraceae bacterium]
MDSERVRIDELMARSGVGFGTSGARGRVVELTAPVCYAYTRGFLQHLEAVADLRAGSGVAIAGDLRASTPAIMAAIAAACVDAGYRPINCGFIPSPAVAAYGIARGIPSIMVTGSHIPDDRNGIKFNTAQGEILKDDEAGIRAQTVALPAQVRIDALPPVDDQARTDYVRRYRDFFGSGALTGMRVAVYEHSGVARDLLGEILVGLGAEVLRLGRSEVFMPVDTEAIRPEDVALARQWAEEHRFAAIVSTDGDADRPLIGTERGDWLRGDVVGVLCAQALGITAVATPVSSNSVVEACGSFARVERTRIGSPFVIAGMQALQAAGHAAVAGYEANGGFLLASAIGSVSRSGIEPGIESGNGSDNGSGTESGSGRDGRRLSALPTRDAVLPILALLVEVHARGIPLSALGADLPPRFTASDRLQDYPTERSRALIEALNAGGTVAMERLFGGLCGKVASIDTTDGLRMRFDNGEIVHLRPSGNAPEFRCYNEADSESRAAELNRACLEVLRRAGG